MRREASAGGVVVREGPEGLELAVIRPHGRHLWALPKGHIQLGETDQQAAIREVREETGLEVDPAADLGTIHYTYSFRGVRIAKSVHFFLFHFRSGDIDRLEAVWRQEVDEARWMALGLAARQLAYRGEREVLARARALLARGRQA
jgi:8-oxo-dGTP pyrophosphatase MutT (NUDIX family)